MSAEKANIIELFKAAVLKIEKKDLGPVSEESHLASFGFDSVTTMEILAELEDELSIEFPEEELGNLETLGDLAHLTEHLLG
ncbi:MAG: acyl carrier protein [Myxococcota bacterium]|nr:acyl carrier protein [Myxococcota bacterium]